MGMLNIPHRLTPQDRAPFKFKKFGSESHMTNTLLKKTRINEMKIRKTQYSKENNEVTVKESDYKPSEEKELPDELIIESINVSFEVK
ncbi:hypothetical protein O181_083809 [Austropuccinia psidii MF-1]|uniref:Uncharacterized protein n=1 Tax=Austropuccinia psidii MF-1 TaxID=1389203 RepID=A0A9Q3FRX4_9BASI|nr:hypothetical protein [Austropuccinia psidii MF-1]